MTTAYRPSRFVTVPPLDPHGPRQTPQGEWQHCYQACTLTPHDGYWVAIECPGCTGYWDVEADDQGRPLLELEEINEGPPVPDALAEQAARIAAEISDPGMRVMARLIARSLLNRQERPAPPPPPEPPPVSDPFAADCPLDALRPAQRERLLHVWERDGFGEIYQRALWSECPVRDKIAGWLSTQDGMVIGGNCGVGKSMALSLMMAALAARHEFSFAYCTAPLLFSFLAEARTENEEARRRLERLRTVRYLFLDDAGSEYAAPWPATRFNELIEERYGRRLLHVVTTNLRPENLRQREGWHRAADRIFQFSQWTVIGGQSRR